MKSEVEKVKVLVLGMGASAFGRERRAVTTLKHTPRLTPYFLISQWEDGSVSRLLKDQGFKFGFAPFGYLGRARPDWSLITLFHLPKLYYKVFKAYFSNHCQTILLLCLHPFINAFFAIILLKLFWKARFVFYLGDIPKKTIFHQIIAWLITGIGDGVIANSSAVKRGLTALGLPEEKIQVVYNGVDATHYEEAHPRNLKGEFRWPEDSILVGFIGQINQKKGIEDFVEAARRIVRREPRARFLVFGKEVLWRGDLKTRLEQRILAQRLDRKIVFGGWQNNIEAIYKAIDVTIIPSRHEDPAPNVAIEAMAAGIPVVATQVGGAPELVEDGLTGFLVEKGDVGDLASKTLELARNSSLRKKMGKAGKERVRGMFDIRKNALRIEEILINGTASPS